MHRRIAPLFLAVLIALPIVSPTSAAEPTTSPSSESSQPPAPSVGPTSEPAQTTTVEPSASPESVGAGTADPGTEPAAADTAAPAAPAADTAAAPASAAAPLDAKDRYIVMLRSDADTTAVVEKARKRDGVKADHSYSRTIRGFAAKLDPKQKRDLLADPNVVAVVPDEIIHLTQTIPTGVSRIGDLTNPIAAIDGTDQRVDADVAIVDTGITAVPDLNVGGGYNCSSSDRTAWRDGNNHGTHVAGIVGALDNSFGVVGVAPGARVWGVKILNNAGDGLISWYVCGLDWVLAQRDPNDASRPLFEAVNMSVTKAGSDDHNCGRTNNDVLHQAICRVVAGGITVVAAAANDHHNAAANIPASYDEVITVSALADTDGKPGGLGGNRCYSWGGYDKDDTFADFSNYGADVDIIAPGKCILSTIPGPGYVYMSGTSMAAPAVAGAVALYKASRPNATPAEVREALRFLGNMYWATSTDPDPYHEPLLDVSRLGTLGTFTLAPIAAAVPTVEGGSTASIPVAIARSNTFFERVTLSGASLPAGWISGPATASPMGWDSTTGIVSVVVPKGTPQGTYDIGVQGTNQGRTMTTTVSVNVVEDNPTAGPPVAALVAGWQTGMSSLLLRISWPAATDPSSAIAGYELQTSRNGGAWGSTTAFAAAQREALSSVGFDATYRFRIRAVDSAGNWSPWAEGAVDARVQAVDDRSSSLVRRGTWGRTAVSSAYRTTLSGSGRTGASMSMSFTGRAVGFVGPRSPLRGKVKVYIDGHYIQTIDMSSRTTVSRQLAFTRTFASAGTHRIMVVVVGTGTHPLVSVDAFVVLR